MLGFDVGPPWVPPRCPIDPRPTPTDPLPWLRVQRTFGLRPECVADALRAGMTAEALLQDPEPEFHFSSAGETHVGAAALETAARDEARLRALGAKLLALGHAGYPESLSVLPDAPPVLLVRGAVAALSAPSIAIVGARAATRSARSQARRLGRELAARGFTIVSGLARGIDAEAHRGALESGGRTVAVLACGLDETYPPEHRALADEIAEEGAVVSEMPFGTPPRREFFPLRNRIISGLSLGIIVAEARRRSGSLITVRHALAQGREVWVLPGANDGPFAEGSNRLLRDGARAIRHAIDVVEDLGDCVPEPSTIVVERAAPEASPAGAGDGTEIEARILARLGRSPATREDLMADVELDPGRLAAALLDLELAGRVVEERDGRFHVCWG